MIYESKISEKNREGGLLSRSSSNSNRVLGDARVVPGQHCGVRLLKRHQSWGALYALWCWTLGDSHVYLGLHGTPIFLDGCVALYGPYRLDMLFHLHISEVTSTIELTP